MAALELWGIEDVAEALGIGINAAYMRKHRGQLPEPEWTISGRPIWRASVIRKWVKTNARTAVSA